MSTLRWKVTTVLAVLLIFGTVGAYPHCGHYKPPEWIFEDITPEAFANECVSWADRGAQVLGGCCGIRPEHIRALADRLPDRPSEHGRRAPPV